MSSRRGTAAYGDDDIPSVGHLVRLRFGTLQPRASLFNVWDACAPDRVPADFEGFRYDSSPLRLKLKQAPVHTALSTCWPEGIDHLQLKSRMGEVDRKDRPSAFCASY